MSISHKVKGVCMSGVHVSIQPGNLSKSLAKTMPRKGEELANDGADSDS